MSSRNSKNSVSLETFEARLFLAAQHGLSASYYNGVAPGAGVGTVNRIDQTVDFYWGSGSPAAGISADKFSARWTGQLVPLFSETYTFSTRTDEGVRLWVNGQLLIDHWTRHTLQTDTGSITLTAGQRYDIKMEYFDYSGTATARLMWSSPSQTLEDIPASQLYPQGPFTAAAPSVNQRIEAENFDVGIPGVAYSDGTSGNAGGAYRNTNVDLQATSDAGGGYNVGWSTAGEWLTYSINVPTSGTYDLDERLAASGKGGAFHVEIDDVNVTGTVAVPNTGGWQTWTTVTQTGLSLSAGRHVIKISQDKAGTNGYVSNLNWLQVRSETPTIAVSSGGTTITKGQSSAIDFGTVPFGSNEPTRTFTVTNRGNGTLTLGVPSLPSGFSLLEGLNSTLAPGASDTFTVGMDTSGHGSYAGTVSIPTNDPTASQFTFALNGNVPASKIAVAFSGAPLQNDGSSQVDYGTLEMGDPARTLVFTVTNQGQADLVLGTPTLPAGFTLADGLSSFLAPGNSDTFAVTMNTDATGDKGGLVSFTTNDPIASTFSFTIDGTITAPQIAMSVNGSPITSGQSSPIDFGSAVQGAAGPSLVFTVANQGNGALNLGTPTVPSGFTLLDAPPATIAAGASDTFTLQMNTATVGAISGSFALPTNDFTSSGVVQGVFNFTLTGAVTAPPTNPVLVPGSGFTGATTQPAAVGTGSMSTENAIARWDVVPYQTFTNTFNVGVVAFDSAGIDHVSFSVNGGAWTDVSTMSVNPTTNVNEYWATLNASNFNDGQLEVRAIAYPKVGVPRVLQGATDSGNGEVSIFLNANHGGTLAALAEYVDVNGSDTSGDGSAAKPYATISKAIDVLKNLNALNGGTIYLEAGTHTFTKLNYPAQGAANPNAWLTITAAPGLARSDVKLQGSTNTTNSQGGLLLVHIAGLTVSVANGIDPIYSGNVGARLWYDNCTIDGGNALTAATYNWPSTGYSGGKYMTDCLVTNTHTGSDGTLARNVTVDTYLGDAFSGAGLVLNCVAKNQNTEGSGAHADVGQYFSAQNIIWQNVTANDGLTDTQGFFVGVGQTVQDVALVSCGIEGTGVERALLVSGTVTNMLILDSAFEGVVSLTGSLNDVIIANTTSTMLWPQVAGVTYR